MRNGLLFSMARATALFSITGAPLVLIVDVRQARAVTPDAGPVPLAPPESGLHEHQFLSMLDDFWQDAWGAEFSLHESGMMLEPADANGARDLIVHAGEEILAQGHYYEIGRYPVAGPGLSADDPSPGSTFGLEHAVTVGVVQGSTGWVRPIYGFAQQVISSVDGAASIVVEGLTPLGVTDTLDGAVAGALETLELLAFGGAGAGGGEPPCEPDADPCLCDEVYFNDLDACMADALACEAACAAVAIAGILGCLALGPLAGPCIAAVLTAEALCMASCLAKQKACNIRAQNQWLLCWLQCSSTGG